MAAGAVAAAVVATVLIVNNQGSHNEAVPAANEIALQAPPDPGPDPFTPSVETQGMTAPAPAPVTSPAQPGGGATSKPSSPAVLHSVEGSSAGLYGGAMGKSSCDTERLIGMVSAGDKGRAWASGAGVAQADIPGYLRSLTPAYLRVDTRVTNHNYKSGAVVEYQSALQAGTAVLVDAQGVPRVRCSCGNPLKPPVLVSNAKYTGKAWTGFQPSTLIVVVPAPQPVTQIILVNVETGDFFARLTGRAEIVDKHVEPPKGPLVPGIPPPSPWKPSTPSGPATTTTKGSTSATTSGSTTSGSTTSGSTTSGSTTSGSTTSGSTTSGSTTSGSTTSGSTTSGSTTSGSTTSGSTTSGSTTTSGGPSSTSATSTTTGTTTSAGSTTTTSKPTTTVSAPATTTAPKTPTATCASTAPSTLPPCPTTAVATPT
ncbi:hypothetical protein BX285_7204 [Streptomyces sp. 1114.5]|uniref:DUF6777 domain-containing protein n=1 Tax=unclassified Streptomyces TaxID=2593676 RepID=UPI000BD180FB|nr:MULTISPECIES: DUF6777 domain-containing protein [unclassified Streptomyces]RKT08837.1 hypothetical protein BX285_7204 [Streptomyces sp. 1114.5]SOB79152.1 hypothetical protein SAMN06272789_0282 [Streptomyces sp. 1331.2]